MCYGWSNRTGNRKQAHGWQVISKEAAHRYSIDTASPGSGRDCKLASNSKVLRPRGALARRSVAHLIGSVVCGCVRPRKLPLSLEALDISISRIDIDTVTFDRAIRSCIHLEPCLEACDRFFFKRKINQRRLGKYVETWYIDLTSCVEGTDQHWYDRLPPIVSRPKIYCKSSKTKSKTTTRTTTH